MVRSLRNVHSTAIAGIERKTATARSGLSIQGIRTSVSILEDSIDRTLENVQLELCVKFYCTDRGIHRDTNGVRTPCSQLHVDSSIKCSGVGALLSGYEFGLTK